MICNLCYEKPACKKKICENSWADNSKCKGPIKAREKAKYLVKYLSGLRLVESKK